MSVISLNDYTFLSMLYNRKGDHCIKVLINVSIIELSIIYTHIFPT